MSEYLHGSNSSSSPLLSFFYFFFFTQITHSPFLFPSSSVLSFLPSLTQLTLFPLVPFSFLFQYLPCLKSSPSSFLYSLHPPFHLSLQVSCSPPFSLLSLSFPSTFPFNSHAMLKAVYVLTPLLPFLILFLPFLPLAIPLSPTFPFTPRALSGLLNFLSPSFSNPLLLFLTRYFSFPHALRRSNFLPSRILSFLSFPSLSLPPTFPFKPLAVLRSTRYEGSRCSKSLWVWFAVPVRGDAIQVEVFL